MLTINDRFKLLLDSLNMNSNSMAVALGYVGSTKIQRLCHTPNKPSMDILEDISNKFDNVNIDWLITGKGSMFKNESLVNNEKLLECEKEKEFYKNIAMEKTEQLNRLEKNSSITYPNNEPLKHSLNEESAKYQKKN